MAGLCSWILEQKHNVVQRAAHVAYIAHTLSQSVNAVEPETNSNYYS